MAKLGAGNRLKEKLDRSTWVDSTDWVADDDPKTVDKSVEFLEIEPSAYRLSGKGSNDLPSPFSSTSSRVAALGAVAMVILALVLISRPDGEDPLSQLSLQEQQQVLERQGSLAVPAGADPAGPDAGASADQVVASTTSTPPQPSPTPAPVAPLGSTDTGRAAEDLAPIPRLRQDLTSELPDVLVGYGQAGTVVFIQRSEAQPKELPLGAPGASVPGRRILAGDPQQGAAVLASNNSFGWARSSDDGLATRMVSADTLLPADDGVAIVQTTADGSEVQLATFDEVSNGPITGPTFDVGRDLTLLGGWKGRVLAHKGGSVWLLDEAGAFESVVDGVPISYDGRHLAVVRCPRPDECEIAVGPVDQPDLRRVPVPEALAERSIESWSVNAVPSPDGTRLAMVDTDGTATPIWLDLDTGSQTRRADGVDSDSPVAWSPDGRWIAYAANGDVVVWDTELDEAWLILLGRTFNSLVWFDDGLDG